MNITKEIYKIVSTHSGTNCEDLSHDLFLEEDLKLVGDDASELLEEIQRQFEVDFSSFDFSLHFSPEVGWFENPEFGYYPVSIGHLIQVVKMKYWFLPEKNEVNFLKVKKSASLFKLGIITFIVLLAGVAIFFL